MTCRALILACVLVGCGEEMPASDAGPDASIDSGGMMIADAGIDSGPVASCEGATDGTPCTGANMICLANACVESVCGDRFVDPARDEACDDGNSDAFDGCDPDCTCTCASSADCDDGTVCNGAETCTGACGMCRAGTPAEDGTPCSEGGVVDGVCHPLPVPLCLAAECGNEIHDTDEACDDGRNGDAADGCGDDCQLACGAGDCTVSFNPTEREFGAVPEGTSSEQQIFTLQNVTSTATAMLMVSIAGASSAEFSLIVDNCMIVLGPFLTCTVTVRFDPQGIGPRQAMLIVRAGGEVIGAAELRGFALGNNGRACIGGTECQSGNCVDDFCCDEAVDMCTGCRSCGLGGSEGTCTDVLAGDDPHGECTDICEDACDGANACRPAAAGTVCATGTCTNQPNGRQFWSYNGIATCDGASTVCNPGNVGRCGAGYACDTSTGSCRGSCVADIHCQLGYYCSGGACVAGANWGQACTAGRDATCTGSTFCASGTCGYCRTNRDCGSSNGGGNCCIGGYCTSCGSCAGSGWGYSEITSGYCERCNSAADCSWDTGPNCINGGCGCFDDWSCHAGQTCVANRCMTASGNTCNGNSECGSGTCFNNVCL